MALHAGAEAEAVFAAKLLVGEVPADIEEPFAACRTALLPREPAELTSSSPLISTVMRP